MNATIAHKCEIAIAGTSADVPPPATAAQQGLGGSDSPALGQVQSPHRKASEAAPCFAAPCRTYAGHIIKDGALRNALAPALWNSSMCGHGLQIRRGSTHESETTITSATRSQDNVLLEVLGTQSDSQEAQNQVPTMPNAIVDLGSKIK